MLIKIIRPEYSGITTCISGDDREYELAGTITLPESVDVTDPCYDKGTWCRLTLNNIVPGKWQCYYAEDEGRVGASMIVNEDWLRDGFRAVRVESLSWVGEIGVDAGLAGYFDNKPDFNDDDWHDLCTQIRNGDAFILSVDDGTGPREGFFTSSGWGDGGYDVRVLKDNDDRIVAIRISFIEEDEEDDDYLIPDEEEEE